MPDTDGPRRADDNPFKPARLTPATLRNDPARAVESSKITSTDYSMTRYDDHSNPATPVSEKRYDFAPILEARPLMRTELSRNFQLAPIRVSPMQMQELRERRAEAKEIGWTIDSATIRIES